MPLALIWYQLPEVLASVETATLAEPFARFLATQLHMITIYESHKANQLLPLPTQGQKMFHEIAGRERSHFHGRNSELRRMLNADYKQVRQVESLTNRVESLASIKRGNDNQGQCLLHSK